MPTQAPRHPRQLVLIGARPPNAPTVAGRAMLLLRPQLSWQRQARGSVHRIPFTKAVAPSTGDPPSTALINSSPLAAAGNRRLECARFDVDIRPERCRLWLILRRQGCPWILPAVIWSGVLPAGSHNLRRSCRRASSRWGSDALLAGRRRRQEERWLQ